MPPLIYVFSVMFCRFIEIFAHHVLGQFLVFLFHCKLYHLNSYFLFVSSHSFDSFPYWLSIQELAKFTFSSTVCIFFWICYIPNYEKSESVSCAVCSNSLRPHGLYHNRLLCPWNSPGKNTGVGCTNSGCNSRSMGFIKMG